MIKLKELRLEKKLTQNELAKKLDLTDKTIWAYENNRAEPNIETLTLFADFFATSVDYLIGRSDDFGNITIKNSQEFSSIEIRLINLFRKLNPQMQDYMLKNMELLASRN